MQPIVAVCYQVCAGLNRSLSVEQLHEPIGPEHLSPPQRGLINDSSSGTWGEGKGGANGRQSWLTYL